MKENLLVPLTKEFKALLLCMRQTVAAVSDGDWRIGSSNRCIPARQACHALSGIDGLIDSPASVFTKHGLVDYRWRKAAAPQDYPSQAQVIAFIDETEPLVYAALERFVDQSCSGRTWSNPPLNRCLYILRHSIIHLSYMRQELIERGIDVPEYIKYVARIMRS